MSKRLLLVAAAAATTLGASPSSLLAADEGPPVDAPASCVAPTGKDGRGLPTALTEGPKVVGTYKLTAGTKLVTPVFSLLATAHFMPERMGSTQGEWLPGLEVRLVKDIEKNGESYRNSVDQHGYDPIRIGTYRVTVTGVAKQKGKAVVDVLVEDLGCLEYYTHVPLAHGESVNVWVSTEATATYAFSTGHWYDSVDQMTFAVTSGLDPDVQQDPGTKTPHGWIAINAWERVELGLPSWDDKYLRDIKVGTHYEMPAYTVDILKIVVGADTTPDEYRVTTKGRDPVIHILAKITRKTKTGDKLIRKPGGD
jgi:hypothetical protein